MSTVHSTPTALSGKPAKPSKPYPDFPLTAHPVGQWCKKIRGKIHYFGPWNDWQAALDNYNRKKDDLHARRTPRTDPEALTSKRLCHAFILHKQALVDAGELSPRTQREYKDACEGIGAAFGPGRLVTDLRPEDFATLRKRMAKKWGAYRLSNVIQ
jgi:hypothetical protein